MFGAEVFVIMFIYVAVPLVVLAALYWVVRLAVRDGILAARARTEAQRP